MNYVTGVKLNTFIIIIAI